MLRRAEKKFPNFFSLLFICSIFVCSESRDGIGRAPKIPMTGDPPREELNDSFFDKLVDR